MKRECLFVFIIFNIFSHFSFSQDIIVELTTNWNTGNEIINVDSIATVPELYISYLNITDTSFYFLKKSGSRNGFPKIPWGTMVQFTANDDKDINQNRKTLRYSKHTGSNYIVRIGGGPLYNDGWIIFNDTTNYEDEIVLDYINDEIADIYQYLFSNGNEKKTVNKIYFMNSEIENNSISSSVKDAFVFLRPNEVYIDTFNLIAFQKVGGNFTFQLTNEESFDYVLLMPSWDFDERHFIEQKKELPKTINEYFLYSRKFTSNKIKVCF
ncbi:MAG: hypothetical protein H0S84_02620 [Bacteroidales bacterium]|jgi:hypothetical protein|nr:hypothetical protein [Bacteroidales bacterium]